jgi:hypothetical protein
LLNYQEKLAVLADSFGKLDEGGKDYIQELTRKLAEIHCGADFEGESDEKDHGRGENWGIYPA